MTQQEFDEKYPLILDRDREHGGRAGRRLMKPLLFVDNSMHFIPESNRIATELDALQAEVDAPKRLQAEASAELDALLPALLDRAFKGEL